MRKCPNISPYVRRPLVTYDFATAQFLIYEENLIIFFISVACGVKCTFCTCCIITKDGSIVVLSSRAEDGLDDFSQKLALINRQTENEGVIRDTEGKDDDDDDMITDKTDDVRVIVSLDGSPGDVDFGNR
jgi:hypothetical protein